MSWGAIAVLAIGAYLFKLGGVAVGERLVAEPIQRAVRLIPPTMFAALVALQTFERDAELVLDARAVGLAVAAVATWRRLPFIAIVVAATAATALTRLLT